MAEARLRPDPHPLCLTPYYNPFPSLFHSSPNPPCCLVFYSPAPVAISSAPAEWHQPSHWWFLLPSNCKQCCRPYRGERDQPHLLHSSTAAVQYFCWIQHRYNCLPIPVQVWKALPKYTSGTIWFLVMNRHTLPNILLELIMAFESTEHKASEPFLTSVVPLIQANTEQKIRVADFIFTPKLWFCEVTDIYFCFVYF